MIVGIVCSPIVYSQPRMILSSVCSHRATPNPGGYWFSMCPRTTLNPGCSLPQWHAHLSYCNIYLILSSGISLGTGFVSRLEFLLDCQCSCVVKYRKYIQRLTYAWCARFKKKLFQQIFCWWRNLYLLNGSSI